VQSVLGDQQDVPGSSYQINVPIVANPLPTPQQAQGVYLVFGDQTFVDVPPWTTGVVAVTPTSIQSRFYFERIATGPGYYQRQPDKSSVYARTPASSPDIYKRQDKPY